MAFDPALKDYFKKVILDRIDDLGIDRRDKVMINAHSLDLWKAVEETGKVPRGFTYAMFKQAMKMQFLASLLR